MRLPFFRFLTRCVTKSSISRLAFFLVSSCFSARSAVMVFSVIVGVEAAADLEATDLAATDLEATDLATAVLTAAVLAAAVLADAALTTGFAAAVLVATVFEDAGLEAGLTVALRALAIGRSMMK